MPRDVDILFCKIAVTAGMVSREQAQKVLVFVDRRERETGRRPIVGAVFTKHQILSPQQVQRVKAAVAKRRGESVAVSQAGQVTRGRGGTRARPRRQKAPKRPVDQQTLVMGGAFGVIFVGVLITICYLFLVGGGGSEVAPSASSQGTTAASLQGRGLAALAGQDDTSRRVPTQVEMELPREIQGDIHNRLSDITQDRIDSPIRARNTLQNLKVELQNLRVRGFTIPDDIESRLTDVESGLALVEAELKEAASGETPAGGGLPPDGKAPETGAPKAESNEASASASKEAEDGDEDDLDLDDLDDLDDF